MTDDAQHYRNPAPTVDILIELEDRPGELVFIERAHDPVGFALPGGFIDDGEWAEAGIDETVAFASLTGSDGTVTARNRLFLPRFLEMKWATPSISIARDGPFAVFRCPVFAWGVCIDLDGGEAIADNFFDLWPEEDYRLPWPPERELPTVLFVGNLTERA